ncbi:hypothetical protein RF400_04065, partial [Acinetobacter baumannii]|nr:hypothetical protein [Acinetobacter baumannii]
FAHAHEYAVMSDNARMTDNEPIHFPIDFRTDNGHRFRVKSQQVSDILLFHFRAVLFVRFLYRLRIARR